MGSVNINIPIDEALIQEAKAFGNQQTERDVVEEALREYVQRRKRLKVLELFGTIDYDADYNYKQQRQQS
ncbi:MAG: type II toxin-antitoxin system VapB family antitoxin [Stigonema ocellatum SAG 48.90 = DSM 106950]|nr:type II toxin-antitoxin system VapB family antitoxin [Stigonema ocellatum SAG 48.90 = DSM 106950]